MAGGRKAHHARLASLCMAAVATYKPATSIALVIEVDGTFGSPAAATCRGRLGGIPWILSQLQLLIRDSHTPRFHFDFTHDKHTMADVVTEFKVGMTCEGCSGACERILKKIAGVTSVSCDIPGQQVLVTGTADPAVMLEALLKWSKASGKSVELVQ